MTKARSNATANAAKGDLTVGSGTNLSGVLGVGSNGDTIVADSSTPTGLKWAAPAGDITGVTAGTGLTGGGTSGAVTLAIDSTVATLTGTQTLTNKTIDAASNTLTGVVTLTGTQTLTNKTLTSPVLTTPTISTIDAKGDLLAGTSDNTIGRLAVGTNNQVLTADSAEATGMKWATPTSSGGWTKVTSSTFSAQTAVSINNCFTSTYKNYRVIVNFTCSATGSLYSRLRVSSADNTTTNYNMSWQYQVISGPGTGYAGLASGSYFYMMDTVTNALGQFLTFDIADPQTSSYTMVRSGSTHAGYFSDGGGYFNAATVFDGLTIYPSTGNITGTISIYGYGA
jgi:hypothetical protein